MCAYSKLGSELYETSKMRMVGKKTYWAQEGIFWDRKKKKARKITTDDGVAVGCIMAEKGVLV